MEIRKYVATDWYQVHPMKWAMLMVSCRKRRQWTWWMMFGSTWKNKWSVHAACTVQTATRFSEIHGIFLGRLKLSMEQLVSSLTGFWKMLQTWGQLHHSLASHHKLWLFYGTLGWKELLIWSMRSPIDTQASILKRRSKDLLMHQDAARRKSDGSTWLES